MRKLSAFSLLLISVIGCQSETQTMRPGEGAGPKAPPEFIKNNPNIPESSKASLGGSIAVPPEKK